jgi:hypothetical protein
MIQNGGLASRDNPLAPSTQIQKKGVAHVIKAVVTKGVIVPRDPLPEDWQEGTEVAIEKFDNDAACDNFVHPTDAWMDEVEAVALLGNREDDERLDAAIQEIRRREKELARKKLGLGR